MAQYTILIKNNRAYNHKLARFYHTTYDVRRSEDVINPKTPHCNVMLLANFKKTDAGSVDNLARHPFLYGRVLGIYHVNVVYTGPGTKGYDAMRFDFLHVRWFQVHDQGWNNCNWTSLRLDHISFPPVAEKDAFGFVDPKLILRGCHILPIFSLGKCHLDGIGLSKIAKDVNDWKGYYVNRFVVVVISCLYLTNVQNYFRFADRDMAMRYHWGLGIGHIYSHEQDMPSQLKQHLPPSLPPEAKESEHPLAVEEPSRLVINNNFSHEQNSMPTQEHLSVSFSPDPKASEVLPECSMQVDIHHVSKESASASSLPNLQEIEALPGGNTSGINHTSQESEQRVPSQHSTISPLENTSSQAENNDSSLDVLEPPNSEDEDEDTDSSDTESDSENSDEECDIDEDEDELLELHDTYGHQ